MTPILPALLFALATGVLPTQTVAQKPAADLQPFVVKVTTLVSGRVVETKDPKTKRSERRTVDRELRWQVHTKKARSLAAARRLLDQLANNPASWRPDPATGGRALPGVQIAPGPSVQWREVVQAFDATLAAGFASATFAGVATDLLMPRAIDAPVVDKATLVVPPCVFCEPDERPPEGRPVFDVHRNGDVLLRGKRVFAWQPGKPEDLKLLRTELHTLREQLAKDGGLIARPGRANKCLRLPVLVRADREAPWRDVHRLLRELTDAKVGFWQVHLAVAEKTIRLR